MPGDGTAGGTYYMLELSQHLAATCTLFGFPGVSAVGAGGHQLGSAAGAFLRLERAAADAAAGRPCTSCSRITDVSNFPASACHPATAVGLRVYAPGAFTSQVIPFSFRACAAHGPVFLHVTTTIGGTGIPGVGN